jgi:hypothetical protein
MVGDEVEALENSSSGGETDEDEEGNSGDSDEDHGDEDQTAVQAIPTPPKSLKRKRKMVEGQSMPLQCLST